MITLMIIGPGLVLGAQGDEKVGPRAVEKLQSARGRLFSNWRAEQKQIGGCRCWVAMETPWK